MKKQSFFYFFLFFTASLIVFTNCKIQSEKKERFYFEYASDQLFPIYGVTLGEATLQQIQRMGYRCQNSNCDIETLYFWDHDQNGVVESIYMTHSDKMPDKWIVNLGFSWRNSYNQWIKILKSQGYTINILKKPSIEIYAERKTLSASFEAYSEKDGIQLTLNFNYGNSYEEGYDIHAPYSLYSITIDHKPTGSF